MVVVSLEVAIHAGCQGKCSDVELPPVNEQRIVDVLLQDAGTLLGLRTFLYNTLYFIKVFGNLDAYAPVRILSWLQNPDIMSFLGGLLVICGELGEQRIVYAFLDMESDW